jgi:hypothetical protein
MSSLSDEVRYLLFIEAIKGMDAKPAVQPVLLYAAQEKAQSLPSKETS